jgi:hypothetical protein
MAAAMLSFVDLGRMSVSSAAHQPINGWIAFQLLVVIVIIFL